LLSNKLGVNLSCETGTCGYSSSYSSVAIAEPELAPYGVAAQSVLIGIYGLAPPLSSNSHVHEYPNITAAYNAVIAQTDPVGFVAMSAICLNGKYPTSGTSALAYFPVQASPEDPSMLVNSYNPLTQAGARSGSVVRRLRMTNYLRLSHSSRTSRRRQHQIRL
jgi:hypothetical protein